MINQSVGEREADGAVPRIRTGAGRDGHAIYGPYETLGVGRYQAIFAASLIEAPGADILCGYLDVTADRGEKILAEAPVFTSQLKQGTPVELHLPFELDQPAELEFRFHVTGACPLLILDNARAVRLTGSPNRVDAHLPSYVRDHPKMLKSIYDMGARIEARGDKLFMELKGVRFNAQTYDDTNFVHEIFVLGAYNMHLPRPTCLVDVGMNVALASLLFATRPFIDEIHAFEPFETTRARGFANIALNPDLAGKIQVNPFGLGDQDGEVTLLIEDNGDSGGLATRDYEGGSPVQIEMRDAAGALAPIIHSARERGLDVVLKIDCEGSEFPIFQSLAAAGLFSKVRGLMVEWHRVFPGRDQKELIAPLLDSGYAVFDISPPSGNGFFYATRYD